VLSFPYTVWSTWPLCLVNKWESKEHFQVGTTREQYFGKTETLQLCSEGRFGMELWVFKEELQPCILLLSQQNEEAVCLGLSKQLKAIKLPC